VVSQEEFK
jgi:Protein of unknown function (DUF3140)/Hypervirulence associated proteins TUDOR domain